MLYNTGKQFIQLLIRQVLQYKQDVFVKHNAPYNGQFKRRQRSQGKFFYTSRKTLSQEMTMCNMEALVHVSYFSEVMTKLMSIFFLNWSNVKIKRLSTYKKISSQGIFM